MLTIPTIDFDAILQTLSEATSAYYDAGIDPLTELPGRKVWETERRKPTTARYLLYLDLDGLKAVNDTHGHAMGDEYLSTLKVGAPIQVYIQDPENKEGDLCSR